MSPIICVNHPHSPVSLRQEDACPRHSELSLSEKLVGHNVCYWGTQPIVAKGFSALLAECEGLNFTDYCATVSQLSEAIRASKPEVLVLDRSLGPLLRGWLDAWPYSPEFDPTAALVVWGDAFTQQEAVDLMRRGVSGVMNKSDSLETIASCFRALLTGQRWFQHFSQLATHQTPETSALTIREREVLFHLQGGSSTKEIAEQLGVAVGTVKIHLKHIYEKMRVKTREQLAFKLYSQQPRYASEVSLRAFVPISSGYPAEV